MDKAGPKNNNCRVDNELNKMVKKKNSFVLDFGSCCCCLVSGKNCSVVLRQTVSHGKLHRFLGHRKCLSSKKNPSFLQIMIPCFSNSELEPSEGWNGTIHRRLDAFFFHWTDAQHFFKSTFSLFQRIFSSLAASFLSSHAKNEKEQKTGPFKFKFCQHENRLKRSESGFCRRRHSPDFHFEMTFFFWWQEQQQRPK